MVPYPLGATFPSESRMPTLFWCVGLLFLAYCLLCAYVELQDLGFSEEEGLNLVRQVSGGEQPEHPARSPPELNTGSSTTSLTAQGLGPWASGRLSVPPEVRCKPRPKTTRTG
jgi:hypothetical protein